MAKKPASTSLPPDIYAELERIAAVDRRSVAQVIATAIEYGLPYLLDEYRRKDAAPPYLRPHPTRPSPPNTDHPP